MRKPVIAGNWKMYKTPKESLAFLQTFLPLVGGHDRDEIVLFPTMSSLGYVLDATHGTNVSARGADDALDERGPVHGADLTDDAGEYRLHTRAAGPL